MSDITLIDDSEQSSLVTNGLAKNGELYLKKAGSTNAGSIVVYDSGAWKTFANEYSDSVFDGSLTFPTIQVFNNESDFIDETEATDKTIVYAKDTDRLYVWSSSDSRWYIYEEDNSV